MTPRPVMPPKPARRRQHVLVGAGVLLLGLAGLVGWLAADHAVAPQSFGGATARALSTEPPANPATSPPTPVSPVSSRPAPPPGPLAEPAAGPVREIWLPARDVRAAVVPVGVTADGAMEIPEDVRTAGWYRFGPAPGDGQGSAVISGHINDRDQGPGVFAALADVSEGEPVIVTMADGRVVRYRVIARERFDKEVVPMSRIFDRAGAPRLTLVTCGGAFDRASGNYRDNIVVTAVPEP